MCFPPCAKKDCIPTTDPNENNEKSTTLSRNVNNIFNSIQLFDPKKVVYSTTTKIEDSMKELEDIEQQQLIYYAQRVHREDIFGVHYQATSQEKEEMTNLYSLFSKHKSLSNSMKTDQVLLKQGSIVVTEGNPSTGIGNIRHLLLCTNSILIASYQDSNKSTAKDYKFKLEHSLELSSISSIVDLGLVLYENHKNTNKTTTNKKFTFSKVFSLKKKKQSKKPKNTTLKGLSSSSLNEKAINNDDSISTMESGSQPQEYNYHNTSFLLVLKSGISFVVTCPTSLHKILWLDAFPHALLSSCNSDNNILLDLLRTNIYSAAFVGDDSMLQRILELYNYNNNDDDEDNDVVRSVLNTKDHIGYTPLHYATREKRTMCMKYLLDAGADPNTKDDTGSTPLDYATQDDTSIRLEMLIANGGTTTSRYNTTTENGNGSLMIIDQMKKNKNKLISIHTKTDDLNRKAVEYKQLSSSFAQQVRNKY